jgi:5-methylcytosine-specific restriction endonuclease McrA
MTDSQFCHSDRARFIARSQRRRQPSRLLRALVLERDGFRCRRCGAAAPDVQLAIDHITPFSAGGLTELGNLQTLCRRCNGSKGARPPEDRDLRSLPALDYTNSRISRLFP